MNVFYLRWAHPLRAQSMPTPEECEAEGYVALGNPDARYPAAVLMRKDDNDE